MNKERLDLSALDPTMERGWLDRNIMEIGARARPELERRRRAARSPLLLLATWARPMFSAAAAMAAISILLLKSIDEPASPMALQQTPGMAEMLQVPAPLDAWLTEERSPTVDDLIVALDGEHR